MYKVFFNDRILFVGESSAALFGKSCISVNMKDSETVSSLLNNFLSDRGPEILNVLTDDETQILPFLHSKFKEIDASGGLVINEKKELLVIRRLGFWDLPKGKIEKGENPEEAGIREVQEECGISSLYIKKALESSYHLYQSPYHNNRWILKKTFWFLMESNSKEALIPQTKEDITEAKWFSQKEVKNIIKETYPSLVFLFNKFLDL